MPTTEQVLLVESGRALESMRSSDFDVYSAYGEVIDNSLQADAQNINVLIKYKSIKQSKIHEPIELVAFGDDGSGMNEQVLHQCLQLGYSSRYNDRTGIGRFGVGATLAAINQCKRVEVYSKVSGGEWLYTYFDLDEINSRTMVGIPPPTQSSPPIEFSGLTGKDCGSLVIWSKYDRQPDDANKIIDEFRIWMGRTYRKFLSNKCTIVLNGQPVMAIDPLYIDLSKTRFPMDPKGFEFPEMKIQWPIAPEDQTPNGPTESTIRIRMTLLPEELRKNKGSGNAKATTERYIHRNEGISILRNDREVFYDDIPHWPGDHIAEIDRWWGCEVSFDAVLDREFTVKNIKRGAIPVRDLKVALAEKINPTRKTALERVREVWAKADSTPGVTQPKKGPISGHETAEAAAGNTPGPKGILDAAKDFETEAKKLTNDWLKHEDEKHKAAWQERFKSNPFTIIDDDWKGPEFVETSHLGGSDVLRYNIRHSFFAEIEEIRATLDHTGGDSSPAKRLRVLIDLLLISHAKAENMIDPKIPWEAEKLLETLRMQWGHFLSNYIATYKKELAKDG
jgi:hypothetical protein